MLRRLVPVVVLAALAALATACDKEDVAQDDDKVAQEPTVRAGLASLYAMDDPAPEVAAEGECFADALLARLDLDGLVQAGIVEDDGTVTEAIPMLEVDVAAAWVDAQASCVEYVVTSARALVEQSEGTLDQAAYRACFEAALTDEQVRAALIGSLSGDFDTPEVAALTAAQDDCARQALPPR